MKKYSYYEEDIDVDGSMYLKMKKDVKPFKKEINETIWKLINKYEKAANEYSYYYLGYHICFTYKNKKYYYDLDFKNTKLEKELINNLIKLNCNDIYVKQGNLD